MKKNLAYLNTNFHMSLYNVHRIQSYFSYFDQLFSYFPTENSRVVFFVLVYFLFDFRGRHSRFGTSNDPRADGACFLISIKDFRDTAMAHAKLT